MRWIFILLLMYGHKSNIFSQDTLFHRKELTYELSIVQTGNTVLYTSFYEDELDTISIAKMGPFYYIKKIDDALIYDNKLIITKRIPGEQTISAYKWVNRKWVPVIGTSCRIPDYTVKITDVKIIPPNIVEILFPYKKMKITLDLESGNIEQKDIWLVPESSLPKDTTFHKNTKDYTIIGLRDPFWRITILARYNNITDTILSENNADEYEIIDALIEKNKYTAIYRSKQFGMIRMEVMNRRSGGWQSLYKNTLGIENDTYMFMPENARILSIDRIEADFGLQGKKICKIDPVKKTAEWEQE